MKKEGTLYLNLLRLSTPFQTAENNFRSIGHQRQAKSNFSKCIFVNSRFDQIEKIDQIWPKEFHIPDRGLGDARLWGKESQNNTKSHYYCVVVEASYQCNYSLGRPPPSSSKNVSRKLISSRLQTGGPLSTNIFI